MEEKEKEKEAIRLVIASAKELAIKIGDVCLSYSGGVMVLGLNLAYVSCLKALFLTDEEIEENVSQLKLMLSKVEGKDCKWRDTDGTEKK